MMLPCFKRVLDRDSLGSIDGILVKPMELLELMMFRINRLWCQVRVSYLTQKLTVVRFFFLNNGRCFKRDIQT